MKMVGLLFLRQVRERPENVKEWGALAKLMLWSEDIELRRQLKTEENAIRRENLAFAKERFQFNMVKKALKALPQLQKLAEAMKDPKIKEYEENRRINEMTRAIFGDEVLEEGFAPENAEEGGAVMEEQKKKAEEERMDKRDVRKGAEDRRRKNGKHPSSAKTLRRTGRT